MKTIKLINVWTSTFLGGGGGGGGGPFLVDLFLVRFDNLIFMSLLI